MVEQTLHPQEPVSQSLVRSPVLGSLVGAVAHTAVCWLALQLDFFRGGEDLFYQIIALVWVGYLAFAGCFALGVNRSFKDTSMTVPIMLWATFSLLLTAYFIDQVRLCVMVMFFAILQPGVFRLRFPSFLLISGVCVGFYGVIIWRVSVHHPEAIDMTAELIQWAAFTLITAGVVMVAAEISSIRTQLARRNGQLAGIVERIQEMAIRDELTGLYNRRHAVERMIKIREMAKRNALDFVVAYVDLDFFKKVNDAHGHHVGDEVLKMFSALLKEKLSGRDFAARLGGEEFLVVLVKSDLAQGMGVADELREAVTELRFPSAPDLRISTSVGVAQFSRSESLDQLLARADDALYRAKQTGRNKVCAATEGSE
ncbi:MAG: GGDEF domain-containing protein [Alcanivoracaceae bacterium]|nr:GGDEF domain-containing protein [Alcanivoracaceae bacterium]